MSKPLRGDTGFTDLIDARDLPKYELRFEVLGTLDEASSALGVVRASRVRPETRELILNIQRDLCWMMSELAVSGDQRSESHITPERLALLERAYHGFTVAHPLTPGFIVPGDTLVGALLHVARSIIRRAERRVAQLEHESPLSNPRILPYLNRLSTLIYAMACAEEAAVGVREPTLARKPEGGF